MLVGWEWLWWLFFSFPPSFFSIFRFNFLSPGIMLVSTVWEIFISVCLWSDIIMEIIFWYWVETLQASWVKYLFEFHSVCWSIQIFYVQRSGHGCVWNRPIYGGSFFVELTVLSTSRVHICTHTLPMSGGGSLFKCCFRLMPSSCFLQFAWTRLACPVCIGTVIMSYSCNLIKHANSSNLGVGSLESWIWCAN